MSRVVECGIDLLENQEAFDCNRRKADGKNCRVFMNKPHFTFSVIQQAKTARGGTALCLRF